MKISDFTLELLGLTGKYSVMINYIEASEGHSEFLEFLTTRKTSKKVLSDNQAFTASEIGMKSKAIPTLKTEAATNIPFQTVNANVTEIPFTISRPSRDSNPARKNIFFTILSF